MSDENKVSRRRALKVIAMGAGAASILPILEEDGSGQHQHPRAEAGKPTGPAVQSTSRSRFFNAREMATIATISELIIPADEQSPGAQAAGVPAFIDLMVSESPNETRLLWRDGLAAIEKRSQKRFSTAFNDATPEQQTSLLKAISKNEFEPVTLEERFFTAIKNLTINGYYTSEIGIHQELRYKGNTYLKEFLGCTHPDHQK